MTLTNEKTPIRLISTDLDGTLLNHSGEVSPRNRDLLKKAKENGIIVVLNSGRSFDHIRDRIPESLFDYASCMNGQDVYCVKEKENWRMPDLTREDLVALFQLTTHHLIAMDITSDETHLLACSKTFAILGGIYQAFNRLYWRFKGYRPKHTPIVTSADAIPCDHAGKACFAGRADTLRLIQQQLPSNLQGTYVNQNWLEVQPKGISKGAALKKIMEVNGIDPSNAVGFGDGENDISMMIECGQAVAMANAMPAVKKIATDFTLSNQADGVAVWLEERI